MPSNHFLLKRASLCVLCSMTLSQITLAQTTENEAGERDRSVLDEVIVTAERREASLQSVPVAVSAFSGEDIDRLNITNIETLVSAVPGLKVDGNARDQYRMALRGSFTSDDSAGTDQSIGLFVDGVYLGRTNFNSPNLFDVERIEVLRGPQGTLWGRNVVGGAVNIITKAPSAEPEADVGLTLGSDQLVELNGRVSGPIVEDRLLGALSMNSKDSDGWVLNATTDNEIGGIDEQSVRGKLQWLPERGGDITLAVDYLRDRSYGTPRHHVTGDDPPTLFSWPGDNRDTTLQTRDGRYNREIYGVNLTTKHDVDFTNGTLTTITALYDLSSRVEDHAFIPGPSELTIAPRANSDETLSFEVLLSGETSRLFWQGGAYVYNNKNSRLEVWDQGAIPGSSAYIELGLVGPIVTNIFQDVETDSYAAYLQGTYAVTDHFNVTLGGRYTNDTKDNFVDVSGDPSEFFLTGDPYTHTDSATWDKFTPKVTVDLQYDDLAMFNSFMTYLTYSVGWKSGGFNPGTNLQEAQGFIQPEEAENIEFGLKSRFLNDRAQLNVALFTIEYTDLQILNTGQVVITTENASASLDGYELELLTKPLENVELIVNYAGYDGEYDPGTVIGGRLVEGNKLIQTPDYSWNFGINSFWPVGDNGEVVLRADYSRKDGVFFQARNNVSVIADTFELTKQSILNMELAYLKDNWEVAVWGRNLTDDKYLLRGSNTTRFFDFTPEELASGLTSVYGLFGMPRTYGVTFKLHFE